MSAKRVNEKGSSSKLAKSLKIMQEMGAVNLGDMKTGNAYCLDPEEIAEHVKDQSIVHGVFTNREDLLKVITALKEADLGMSVVISGLFKEVFEVIRTAGLKPHSVNISLGVWGKKAALLPREECLRICTMCGHGMISPFLVEALVNDVKKKRITIDEAVIKLSKCCVCGVFNTARAADLIKELTGL
jgi:hypothetical protein